MTVREGTVFLVGAGPGDPGLMTVRGLELLRRADVVLYDRLVDAAVLEEAPPSALLIDVGKGPVGDAERQSDINETLVRHARDRRVVVRLKGGDPFVFGRGWEEREACRKAGVPCEVVPGISSALAAPASADIPVTCRGMASSVMIVAAPAAQDAHLEALAKADTGVVLMGMRGLADLTRRLIALGRSPSTPAAVIERATLPGQRVIRAPLAEIASTAAASDCRPPAVIVIGPTAAAQAVIRGPLSGKRVVITRPIAASHELAQALRSLGADVTVAPLIGVRPIEPSNPDVLDRLREFDWIVFSSRHGVRGFRRALEAAGGDTRRLGHARVAAVGPVTARELLAWGLRADLEASPARADALVTALLAQMPRPHRVLFPCGTLALDTIPDALAAGAVAVERLTVYATTLLPLDDRSRATIGQGVDAVLLASPSAATALGYSGERLGHATVVCIGPTTATAAAAFGWNDVRVAHPHSDSGMIATTVRALGSEAIA